MNIKKLSVALFLISAGLISFNLPTANAFGGGDDEEETSCGSGSLGDFCAPSDGKETPGRTSVGGAR